MPETRSAIKLESAGALTAGANKDRWQAPFSGEIVSVSAVVGTAPTGAAILLDVNKNGTTVFTTQANRPTVPISATETADATTHKPDDAVKSFAKGDTISLDIDQVGSTVAGSDLDVTVEYVAV